MVREHGIILSENFLENMFNTAYLDNRDFFAQIEESKKEKLIWDINYHQEHFAKDVERDNERSNWVKNLIDSLPTE